MGAIKTLNLNRRNATPQAITSEKGIYREPAFSPDGQTLLFRKESGNNHQGHAYTVDTGRSEEHTSELQSRGHLVCRLLLEKKNNMVQEESTPLREQT